MDANGGCGIVLSISQSVCQTPYQALHYCLYYIKLWLVNTNIQESILLLFMYVHRNTISIHVSGSFSRIPSQH